MDTPTERTDWLTVLREQGRTIGWLADKTGKPRRTVYAYSRGDIDPPQEWIADVAEVLGQPVTARRITSVIRVYDDGTTVEKPRDAA